MSVKEQREIKLRVAKTSHDRGGFDTTDPIRIRPKSMSRREWRELVRKGNKAVKKHNQQVRREEAAMPESEKLDRRAHEAGLFSPRDMGRILPVEIKITEHRSWP